MKEEKMEGIWRFRIIFVNNKPSVIWQDLTRNRSSLLRRDLLQPRWVETRGGWEEGKIKVRIVPRAPVFLLPYFSFTGIY